MNRYLTPKATEKSRWDLPSCLFSLVFSVIAVEVWIEDSPADEDFVIWLLAHLTVMALILLPLFFTARRRLRKRRARDLADRLLRCRRAEIPLVEADKILGVSGAAGKIEALLRLGYMQNVESDGMCLLLDEPWPETPEPEPESAPEQADIVSRIRHLNDEIDDDGVSRRIERIERATAGILATIEQRPERADDARRFMNYYLPTTMKLLESYRLMEKQSFQGEHIQDARRRIEEVLDKLAAAAEQQQDKLYTAEALDVEAEISVLETMMASDGLLRRQGEL